MATTQYDFDLLVIGGGSGGVRAARWAARLGARVALCESGRMGGTCVLRGCIPKKLMWEASQLSPALQYFSSCGWDGATSPRLNWMTGKQARDKELKRLELLYEKLLLNHKVSLLKGPGKITAPHKVQVGDQSVSTRFILIATGATPFLPEGEGFHLALNSNDLFELKSLPSSLLIMGSGYIGLEFASIFNNLGSRVTLISRREFVLRGFDRDVRKFLGLQMQNSGITVLNNDTVSSLQKQGPLLKVLTQQGKQIEAEKVLFATGRKPATQNLGLSSLGIQTNSRGEIVTHSHFETSVKGIYAIGDCANTPYQLTPTALSEGMYLAEHLFSRSQKTLSYHLVPTAVFTDPPVACVGLSEGQALQNHKIKVFTSEFRPLKYTVTPLQKKTFMKLIVEEKTDKVLGLHIVGDQAPEIIQGFAVALTAGATKKDFDNTIGVHPTSAEELVSLRTPRTPTG